MIILCGGNDRNAHTLHLRFQVGSDVFLCYKKSMNQAPAITYKPGTCLLSEVCIWISYLADIRAEVLTSWC